MNSRLSERKWLFIYIFEALWKYRLSSVWAGVGSRPFNAAKEKQADAINVKTNKQIMK